MIVHILMIVINSAIATFLILPVSALDVYYVATFGSYNIILTLAVVIVVEVIMAWLTFKFGKFVVNFVIRKPSTQQKLIKVGENLGKWGWWLILVSAMTPLPYSLMIYSAGSVNWGNDAKFISAILIGRSVKYIAFTVALYFGW